MPGKFENWINTFDLARLPPALARFAPLARDGRGKRKVDLDYVVSLSRNVNEKVESTEQFNRMSRPAAQTNSPLFFVFRLLIVIFTAIGFLAPFSVLIAMRNLQKCVMILISRC